MLISIEIRIIHWHQICVCVTEGCLLLLITGVKWAFIASKEMVFQCLLTLPVVVVIVVVILQYIYAQQIFLCKSTQNWRVGA